MAVSQYFMNMTWQKSSIITLTIYLPSKDHHFEDVFSSKLRPCLLDLEKHRQHLLGAANREKKNE
jgi:hypothetical protein